MSAASRLLLLWFAALSCLAPARAQQAPPAALALMRPGGISVRYEVRDIGGEKVGIHVYVVPKGRNPDNPIAPEPGKKGPITRDEITVGTALQPSPFYVDLFSVSDSKLTRLNSATYQEEGDVSHIFVKWLQPAKRRGPILLIESRQISHYTHRMLIGFPDGLRGKRVFTQYFLAGGESETFYTVQQFDRTDARGFLMIEELSREGDDAPERVHTYHWDGKHFTVSPR